MRRFLPIVLLLAMTALALPSTALVERYIDGCGSVGVDGGGSYDTYCYYQKDNKVCVGPTDVCSHVPGAGQSTVACAMWVVEEPGSVPPECT